MMMFFGIISSARSGGNFWRRVRLRSAIATARLAFFCPMTCLSSDDLARSQFIQRQLIFFGG